jgi:RNA-directed DNA polymerase
LRRSGKPLSGQLGRLDGKLRYVPIRLNQIMRGWASYYEHVVCKHTLGNLAHLAWWRVIRWLRTLHR